LPGPLLPVPGAGHFTITHELRDADGPLTRQLMLLARSRVGTGVASGLP